MEQYFDEEEAELPSILQISRKDFSDDTFVVDEFLTRFHKYQTLEDLHKQLKSWDKTLAHELVDIINEDYGDFVGLGNSLSGGEGTIQDVKLDVLRFQAETKKVKIELDKMTKKSNKLIAKKQELISLQDLAREMILYLKKIDNLENYVGEHDSDIQDLARFGKLFIEIKLLSRDINLKLNRVEVAGEETHHHAIIDETAPRVLELKRNIIGLINSVIKDRSSSYTSDDLLKLATVKTKLLQDYD